MKHPFNRQELLRTGGEVPTTPRIVLDEEPSLLEQALAEAKLPLIKTDWAVFEVYGYPALSDKLNELQSQGWNIFQVVGVHPYFGIVVSRLSEIAHQEPVS